MNESIKKNCQECGKEFLIIPQEEAFYKQKKLPLPEKCFECRRNRRSSLRNPRKLYERKCAKCGNKLMSTYPPDSPYIIYCESCYIENVA